VNTGIFLLATLGGGIGACLRFIIDGLIMRKVQNGFPLGTFLINTSGSFLLGFLTGLAASSVINSAWLFVLGGGILGGYTTFSTAMVDTVHLLHARRWSMAIINGLAMIVLTVLAGLIGLDIGRGW
jgi:CrcB protein